MKKWLNIKPMVYDFSEDEVDTETESEDDGIFISYLTTYLSLYFLFFDDAFLQFPSSLLC